MSRWTQFVSMATAQVAGRSSLRDIETTLNSQKHLNFRLGSGSIKRTTLSRTNQNLSPNFFEALFTKLYKRCQNHSPKHKFRLEGKTGDQAQAKLIAFPKGSVLVFDKGYPDYS